MNKQIEEIDHIESVLWEANHKKSVLDYRWLAQAIYNAGYRKIPTNDWLTKGISEEQLEREKQEALDEFAERNGYCKASEIFEATEKLFRQRFSDEVDGEYRINAQEFAELKKKYESEGADDDNG